MKKWFSTTTIWSLQDIPVRFPPPRLLNRQTSECCLVSTMTIPCPVVGMNPCAFFWNISQHKGNVPNITLKLCEDDHSFFTSRLSPNNNKNINFLRAGFEPAIYGYLFLYEFGNLLQSTALPTELSKAWY